MNEIQKQAIEKIEQESRKYTGDQYGQAVYKPVADTLMQFCQNEQFATAIIDSDKTFSDCIKAVVKDVRGSLPDIEAYRRAVKFYFPTADIKFDMRIILSGEDVEKPVETVDNSQEKTEAPADQSENKIISLFDIL